MRAILTAIIAAAMLTPAPTARELIDAAQQALAEEQFEEAMDLYEQAGALMPGAAEIPYNMGVAAYRAGEMERASALFDKARTLAADPAMQARSAYNLGTTSARQAIESRTGDPAVAQAQMQDATESLKTAIERFRDSIALNPDNEDARANGELAWRWLKQLEEMQDQMQQEGRQQNQEGDESQDQQEQQDQQQGEPQDQQQQQQGEQEQPPEQEQEQQQPAPSDEQLQEQEQQQEQASPDEKPMSREEAERLLQSVRDKEAQRREELARLAAGGQRPVEKDW